MASFPAVIQLSSLDGTTGFVLTGQSPSQNFGFSVASAGDINGDGYDDLIVGARSFNPGGAPYAGASYVVFGKPGGFAVTTDVSTLDGTNGFRLDGAAAYEQSGRSVAAAGDLNGDGYGDLVVGVPYGDGIDGVTYVVFGKASGFATVQPLADLDGTSGFRLHGPDPGAGRTAWQVASAGDVNGDGFADLIISGRDLGPGYAGGAFVVFGTDQGFAADIELADLDGTDGFRLSGVGANDQAGWSVASAGDVNNDGFDDVIVSATQADPGDVSNAGSAYVVFGKAGGFAADIALSGLDGTNGFRIDGVEMDDRMGRSVAAGDINGDGVSDLIMGAQAAPNSSGSGRVYVVFGSTGGYDPAFSLADLDGTNGFRLDGPSANFAGWSLDAGDVNGDGFDDLIIGAWLASPGGVGQAGSTYVVFGKAGGFAASASLAALDGTDGFRLDGSGANSRSGYSVASAGDVDGDGVTDLIIGAPYAGAAYIVFGRLAAPAPVVETGTAGSDSYTGGALDDQLSGQGGNDILRGEGGDDLLDGGDLADLLYGGDGADDLVGGAGGDTLFGDDGADELSGGDGNDKLYGGTGADNLNGGTGNDRMDGQSDIDTLIGGAGNDYIDGGSGADIMSGGADNDVYIVDDAGDQTIELEGEGYDIVRTTLSWTLADNVECLQLQGATDADGTGNSGANNIQGNAGANTLSGLAGVDTLNGNDGDDIIIGGEGNDLLRGGTGADTFLVAHAFGGALETDQIYDFSTADGDILDLSGIDADTGADGDQAFTVVSAFTGAAGQMTLSFAAGVTTVRLDVDGNGNPDYQAKINGDVTGDWSGWAL